MPCPRQPGERKGRKRGKAGREERQAGRCPAPRERHRGSAPDPAGGDNLPRTPVSGRAAAEEGRRKLSSDSLPEGVAGGWCDFPPGRPVSCVLRKIAARECVFVGIVGRGSALPAASGCFFRVSVSFGPAHAGRPFPGCAGQRVKGRR